MSGNHAPEKALPTEALWRSSMEEVMETEIFTAVALTEVEV